LVLSAQATMMRSIYSDSVRIFFSLAVRRELRRCIRSWPIAIDLNNGTSTRSHIPFIAL
jgi:hypothetical protein